MQKEKTVRLNITLPKSVAERLSADDLGPSKATLVALRAYFGTRPGVSAPAKKVDPATLRDGNKFFEGFMHPACKLPLPSLDCGLSIFEAGGGVKFYNMGDHWVGMRPEPPTPNSLLPGESYRGHIMPASTDTGLLSINGEDFYLDYGWWKPLSDFRS